MKIYITRIEPFRKDLSEIIPLLNPRRQERVSKQMAQDKKLQSIYAGLLIRYAYLQEGQALPWEEVEVGAGENDKPYFKNVDNLYYSLSHSHRYCAVVFDDKPIGCDIQFRQKVESNIVERFFSKSEVEMYKNLEDDKEKKDTFYRLWCMKEACSKLNADGIPSGLGRYIYINDNIAFDSKERDNINIKFYQGLNHYMLAVASTISREFPKNIELIEASDLY